MKDYSYRAEITGTRTVTLFCNDFPLVGFNCHKSGWRAYPNTASGNPSRFDHPTLLASAGRYSKDAKKVLKEFCAENAEKLEEMKTL